MKLNNIVLAAALSLPLLALADNTSGNPFAGAFVGAGLGYANTAHNFSAQDSVGDSATAHVGDGGLAGQVFAGYNFALNANWLVGVQANYTADSTKTTQSLVLGEQIGPGSGYVTAKMPQSYGIDALLGYAYNQSSMVFAGLGWASSKLKLDESLTIPNSDPLVFGQSYNYSGWDAMVGAQQNLTDAFSIRESLDYVSYKSKIIGNLTSGDYSVSFSARPTQYRSLISLIYTFNM